MLARVWKSARQGLIDWRRLPYAPYLGWRLLLRPTEKMEESGKLDNYLVDKGWPQTCISKKPIGPDGKPIPWFTYPFIDFLELRIRPHFQVFEYGSGYSTLWWNARVARVVACEHDAAWAEHVKNLASGHIEVIAKPDPEQYAAYISNFQRTFDIIVIDGEDRITCVKHALGALTLDGIIIWDNSDRHAYNDGFRFCEDNGFRRLDFWGMGPINPYGWCTSVFYKDNNCLKI